MQVVSLGPSLSPSISKKRLRGGYQAGSKQAGLEEAAGLKETTLTHPVGVQRRGLKQRADGGDTLQLAAHGQRRHHRAVGGRFVRGGERERRLTWVRVKAKVRASPGAAAVE